MFVGEGKVGLAEVSERIFGDKCSEEAKGSKAGYGKLEEASANSQIPNCPKCRSAKTWHNGTRPALFGEPIQRLICRDCGFRFSDPKDVARAKKELQEEQLIESKKLRIESPLSNLCQICDETSKFSVYPATETENLVTELYEKKLVVPQKEAIDTQDLRGAVVDFIFHMQQQNRAEITKTNYSYNLDYLITYGANLFDPLSVKYVLQNKLKDPVTQKDKSNARKYNLLKAYKAFATAYEIDITAAKIPKYKPGRGLPYLPPETHLDQLIAACGDIMAAYLQVLKETAARPVEACRILWEEVDFVQRKIPIIHPAKDNNPRVLNMSEKLYNMLKKIEHTKERVFHYKNERVVGKTFNIMRQKAIRKTGMPSLRKIHLYTFRYWRGTVEFQETGQEASVMILLGHTSTRYIWLYVQLSKIYFGGTPKYTHVWVNDREEEGKLVDEGYTLVRTDPKDGASLYCKKILGQAAQLIGHD